MRRVGVVSVVAVVLGLVPAPVASADGATLWVYDIAACSDSGPGTRDEPFCTVQAAADVVEPGQTVQIVGDQTESVVITRSGEEGAPVTFSGGKLIQPAGADPVITIRDTHDVVVRDMRMEGAGGGAAVAIDASARVNVDRVAVASGTGGSTKLSGVRIAESSAVTVSRSYLNVPRMVEAVRVDGGEDVTITGNSVDYGGSMGVVVDNVERFAITGNTIEDACLHGIAVTGASTGSVQNNIVIEMQLPYNGCPAGDPVAIEVDEAAAQGVALDYNIVDTFVWSYRWAGTDHNTPADLHAATGQGAHDLKQHPEVGTPAVDSGNADAPGVLDIALNGPRVDDPAVPNTGGGAVGYVDRGAWETQDRIIRDELAVSATKAPVGGTVTVGGALESQWGLPFTCRIDYGDGTVVTDSPCTGAHTYTAVGTYTVTVTATTPSLLTTTAIWQVITVVPAGGELTPTIDVVSADGLGAWFEVTGGASPWNVVRTTFDYGFGSPKTVEGTKTYLDFGPGVHRVRAAVTDAGGRTAVTEMTYTTAASGFVRIGPARLLDTRTGTGAAQRKLAPHSTVRLTLPGRAGIPADVTAAAMNLTVTNTAGSGYVTAYPAGKPRPTASTVDFRAGHTTPAFTMTAAGNNGAIDIYNGSGSSIDLIADVTGYFGRGPDTTGFTLVSAKRAFDTRDGSGLQTGQDPIPAGGVLSHEIENYYSYGIPHHVGTVLLNVTVTRPRASGYLTAYASGASRPTASNLNFVAGQTVTNTVVAPVGDDGRVNYYASATTDLVVDVVGYFQGGDYFVPLTPTRKVDTRTGTGGPTAPLAPRSTTLYTLQNDATAVVYSTKVVNARSSGYLTAFSGYEPPLRPDIATLNFTPGTTTANVTTTQSYRAHVHNGSDGTIDLILDVTGYFTDK